VIYDQSWYDEVLVEEGSPAMLPLEESPWLLVYREVAAQIHPTFEVVDLGCGTGRFISLLWQEGHEAVVLGLDWSERALEEAREYAAAPEGNEVRFECCDLEGWSAGKIASATVFVCLETLEHLDNDLDLIRRIPPGHRLLFSVPNFWTESHQRVFRDLSEIWARYDSLLTFRSWTLIGDDAQGIHVLDTVRRGDAW
jgi:2-polyprenyl-3-methyl-5-hydroxy-6-metoxy-1,4-benzoquinol methylase